MAARQWAGTTFGDGRMLWALRASLRVLDPRLLYVFAYIFVVPFVLVFAAEGRRHSWAYFRRRQGWGILHAAWGVYCNHCRFAEVIIDRFAMYAGRKFPVVVDGVEEFDSRAALKDGFVQLSSHIGNYEIAGYSLVSDRKTIHAVVFAREKEAVMKNRQHMFDKTNINMIAMDANLDFLFEIDAALAGGDIVSFPTDRYMPGSKCLEADFMGGRAYFPLGPFRVATMRSLDVLAVNVMKEGWMRYRIYVRPLSYDKTLPRKDQLAQLSQLYVAELEKRVRQYPCQWYNFFDFWAA